MIGFILKVLIASTLLSCAIKYGGAYLPVQGNTPTVLIAVLTPSVVMAILFSFRWMKAGR
jgi:ABC-type Mn2+/Zn2+ transport system permease subunit